MIYPSITARIANLWAYKEHANENFKIRVTSGESLPKKIMISVIVDTPDWAFNSKRGEASIVTTQQSVISAEVRGTADR